MTVPSNPATVPSLLLPLCGDAATAAKAATEAATEGQQQHIWWQRTFAMQRNRCPIGVPGSWTLCDQSCWSSGVAAALAVAALAQCKSRLKETGD